MILPNPPYFTGFGDRIPHRSRDPASSHPLGANSRNLGVELLPNQEKKQEESALFQTSGGIYHDCAVHDIDLATWVLGEYPTEVYSAANSCIPEIGMMISDIHSDNNHKISLNRCHR